MAQKHTEKFDKTIGFIRDIYPGVETVALHEPLFVGNELKYLKECIDSSFVSSVGPFVDRFESMMETYTGARKAIVCDSGTNALFIALLLSGVERGDEVITQPLTFIATANAIVYCGAAPVFVDVNPHTLGLDADKLESFLKENTVLTDKECINKKTGKRIRSCVVMHTFGHPAEIIAIKTICDRYNIALVEDAAESLGSTYRGRQTGTFGLMGVFSFNGNKTVTTGGGGMIVTNDVELGTRAKHLTTQAKLPHPWDYSHDEIGYNYRMPNLNAALGCAQMENLDTFLLKKRQLAKDYEQFFNSIGIRFQTEPADCVSNFWLNAVFLKSKAERDLFLEYTNSNGIKTRPAWKLMNTLPMFEHCQTGDISNAIDIENTLVNVPSSVPGGNSIRSNNKIVPV